MDGYKIIVPPFLVLPVALSCCISAEYASTVLMDGFCWRSSRKGMLTVLLPVLNTGAARAPVRRVFPRGCPLPSVTLSIALIVVASLWSLSLLLALFW